MTFTQLLRRLMGRGRRRRFFVSPSIRQVNNLFKRAPILANAIVYGSLCAGAEISQQTLKHYFTSTAAPAVSNNNDNKTGKKAAVKYDFAPVKRLALWGTIVIPPIYHKWYNWLDKMFPIHRGKNVTSISKRMLVKKTILDQFLFTPPLLLLFFASMAAMERPTLSHVKEEVGTKFVPVFVADCAFWMPVQAFNFAFVPLTFRVVYIGVMSFVWLNILCFAKSYKPASSSAIKQIP